MKRTGIISVVLLAFMLLVNGCFQSPDADTKTSTLDRVQKTGVLKVGYFLFEPTVMLDNPNDIQHPRGLFVDVIEQIAKDMKWKIEYHKYDLQNFAAALQSDQADVSIGATFSSPSRAGGIAFTRPLFYMGYTGVARKDSGNRFKTWPDLDQPGVRVAVKQGSAIADYVKRNFSQAQVSYLEQPGLNPPLAAVPAQADVGLMNQITVFCYLRDNPDKNLSEILADAPVEFTSICWAVKQGDPTWLEFINTCLQYYEDTGRYAEWEKKYNIPFMYRQKRSFSYESTTGRKTLDR